MTKRLLTCQRHVADVLPVVAIRQVRPIIGTVFDPDRAGRPPPACATHRPGNTVMTMP